MRSTACPTRRRVLKIAADAFPSLRVLATGSSSLAATRKFRDSLTGRKQVVHLPPVLWPECQGRVRRSDLDRRLLHGGLPEMLLAAEPDPEWYAEWLDSFYARDIQELFGIRERTGFLNLLRLMLHQSGGLVDYSALSRECDLSRPTVKAHLEAMADRLRASRPCRPSTAAGGRSWCVGRRSTASTRGSCRSSAGGRSLRDEDRGPLWEHLVLDVLRTASGGRASATGATSPTERSTSWSPAAATWTQSSARSLRSRFDPANLTVFRQHTRADGTSSCRLASQSHTTSGLRDWSSASWTVATC